MILVIRLVPHGRCEGCGALGHVCQRTLLCLTCLDLKIRVTMRKQKLTSTLAGRFAYLKEKAAEFQREFR